VELSEKGGSSKLYQVILILVGSPTSSPTSSRVVLAHLGLFSGSSSAYAYTNSASDCTDSISESFESLNQISHLNKSRHVHSHHLC
jgi:hypothetical protein